MLGELLRLLVITGNVAIAVGIHRRLCHAWIYPMQLDLEM